MHKGWVAAALLTTVGFAMPAVAQNALDRVDPANAGTRVMDELPEPAESSPVPVVERQVNDTPAATIAVGGIHIAGLQEMSRSEFSDIVEDYIGRTIGQGELAELVERLAARARESYPLASAWIEPQTIRAGILQARIDEGRIDDIRLDGPQNSAVLATLQPLVSGAPVTTGELERRILIAGDVAGVYIGETRVENVDGRNVLVVGLSHRKFAAQLTVDNDSTKPIGPLELFGTATINRLLSDDDALQIFALDTVPEIDELAFGRLRYGKRISPAGTQVSITGSYSRSAPGAYLEPYEIKGESWLGSVAIMQPLWRSRRTSLWIEGTLLYREIRQEYSRDPGRQDRLTVAQADMYGYTDFAGGRLRFTASVLQGLDALGATERADPLSSRPNADGTFTKLSVFADWTRTVVTNLDFRLATRSQIASQPLLISEEMGLGGATFGRGYDYSERSGDKGVMGYAELNYDLDRKIGPVDGIEIYAFADGGKVSNIGDSFGNGTLFSTGGGLRADVNTHTDATFEFAVPLSGDRYDTGNQTPRLRFSVTRYFWS